MIVFTQPMLGDSVSIQAIVVSRPGIANDISASECHSSRPGASVRSTTQATSSPSTNVAIEVPIANTRLVPEQPVEVRARVGGDEVLAA